MKHEGDPMLQSLIQMFARRVSDRRMEILSLFEDHAGMRWASPGHVTVSQFSRAIDLLGFKLKREEMEALCRVYCDTDFAHEFNYVDFCAAVDPIFGRDGRVKGLSPEAKAYYDSLNAPVQLPVDKANQNPYYDKFGRVKPLVSLDEPLSAKSKNDAKKATAMLKCGLHIANTSPRLTTQEEVAANYRHMDKTGFEIHMPPETDFEKLGVNEEGVDDDIQRIQVNIFRRRIRAKEFFKDFDKKRTGICTREQFCRGVAHIVHPNLLNDPETPIDVDALADYFKADLFKGPPSVNYGKFCKVVDAMFKPEDLLDCGGFKPRKVRDEAGLRNLLSKIEHLVEVQSIDLNRCFNDCARSDADMRAGRIQPEKFMHHFPLARFTPTQPAKVTKKEMELLIQRYTDDNGWMRLFSFMRDIEEVRDVRKKNPYETAKLTLPALTPRRGQADYNTINTVVGRLGL